MRSPNIFAVGGIAASLILLVAGAGSAFVGFQGREDVRDTLRIQAIVGPEDSTIPGQLVDTGAEARAQAEIIQKHQLERAGGLRYAEMGRFATPDGEPKGTNVAAEAAVGPSGNPLPNEPRNNWITATTLITALETAYFAEQVGNFAILMGITLMVAGIGLAVLVGAAILHMPAFEARRDRAVGAEL